MPVETKIANHTCNALRRQLKNTFPDHEIFIILHKEDERKKAFLRETSKISSHPAGHSILEYFKKNTGMLSKNRSCYGGLATQKTPGFLGFFRSCNYAALIFINQDRFNNEAALRNHALHLFWHALSVNEQCKGKTQPNIFIPADTKKDKRRNLEADIFSACFQKLLGRTDAFESLLTQRMKDTLTQENGFIAENFPFPVCMDTLEFVMEDHFDDNTKKHPSPHEAINITKEISQTIKPATLDQWSSFAHPAQEMAWCGFEKEVILGCAVYTSENTYTRSIADMVAEHLKIVPAIIPSSTEYNPFADHEVNERLHQKQIQENIQSALTKIFSPTDYTALLKEAKTQNEHLLLGNPIGWAANAMIGAANALKQMETAKDPATLRQQTLDIFNQTTKNTTFEQLLTFANTIFEIRRKGQRIDKSHLQNIPANTSQQNEIISAITTIWDMDDNATLNKTSEKNISSFITPQTIKQQ